MTNLDSVLRSRDITLPTKVDIVRALIFPVMYRYEKSEVAQSCLTLCDPLVCSLPGSPLHGIFQARILEWVAISFSRGSSRPRDQAQVSHIVDRWFTIWATSWTIKKAEHWIIYSFKLWFWRRFLRILEKTARKTSQSILRKSILNIQWKDWCWRWSSNTLATWCEEPTYWKRPWWWERLKTEGDEGSRGWDG